MKNEAKSETQKLAHRQSPLEGGRGMYNSKLNKKNPFASFAPWREISKIPTISRIKVPTNDKQKPALRSLYPALNFAPIFQKTAAIQQRQTNIVLYCLYISRYSSSSRDDSILTLYFCHRSLHLLLHKELKPIPCSILKVM